LCPGAAEGLAKWNRAVLAASTTVKLDNKALPHWALDAPRYLQSPMMADYRERKLAKGVRSMTAAQERAKGLGDRDDSGDDRPLLVDDSGLVARV
jgi:hypothetical protein